MITLTYIKLIAPIKINSKNPAVIRTPSDSRFLKDYSETNKKDINITNNALQYPLISQQY